MCFNYKPQLLTPLYYTFFIYSILHLTLLFAPRRICIIYIYIYIFHPSPISGTQRVNYRRARSVQKIGLDLTSEDWPQSNEESALCVYTYPFERTNGSVGCDWRRSSSPIFHLAADLIDFYRTCDRRRGEPVLPFSTRESQFWRKHKIRSVQSRWRFLDRSTSWPYMRAGVFECCCEECKIARWTIEYRNYLLTKKEGGESKFPKKNYVRVFFHCRQGEGDSKRGRNKNVTT